LVESVREGNDGISSFDTSVFTGDYVTGDVDGDYLANLQKKRSDFAKQQDNAMEDVDMVMDIHNEGNL